MSNAIGIVSGKGGVGKTTTAINLTTALHDFNHDVTLVDANLRNPNVLLHLELLHVPIALQHVLNEGENIKHTIRVHHTGLKIVPSHLSYHKDDLTLENLKAAIQELEGTVIIDSPPGMDEHTQHIIHSSDKLIVVLTPDVAAVTDAVKIIKLAKEVNKTILGLIVNRVKNDSYDLTADEIEIMCEVPIIAEIPEDGEIRKSIFHSLPVVRYNPYSKATIEYNKLAAKLLKQEYFPPKFASIKRALRF